MKRSLLSMTLAAAASVCFLPANSKAAVEAWVRSYNGPGNGDDRPTAIAADKNGNLFVTGYSTGSGSSFDFATIKYSNAGLPLWTNHYDGPGGGSNAAYALAVDSDDNVFVTGVSWGGSSGDDYATIKYSGSGVPLWTNRYNGPANVQDVANALAVDISGHVLVAGYSVGSDSSVDYATIKYSGEGVPLWTNRYPGVTRGIAVDGNGNVFVTGGSSGVGFLSDYATIKYSSAGVPLWTNRYNNSPASGGDYATAVAVDNNGNAIVTGYSWGGSSGDDYATIKYSSAGMPLWTKRYSGTTGGHDVATAVAVDASGNVFVTGRASSSASGNDYVTIKYSGAGVPLWTNRYNGPGNSTDEASAMALDAKGNVFVTGRSSNGGVGYEYATIAYSGEGMPLWTNRTAGPGTNTFNLRATLAVDVSGNVFVAGYSPGNGSADDYKIIKYSSASPSLTVARTTTNTVMLSWPSSSAGFTLQENINGLTTVNWSNVLTAPLDDGINKSVIVNPSNGNRFYRLTSP